VNVVKREVSSPCQQVLGLVPVSGQDMEECLSENETSQSKLLQCAQHIIFHSVLQTVGGTFQI